MKLFLLRMTVWIYLISSSTIWGDIILLKTGKIIEGKFIESNEQFSVVDNFEKKIKIPNSQIDSVEVGFSGIPVCYQLKENPIKNCKALLHILSESKVVIVYGKGFLEILEKDPHDFEFIHLIPNIKRDRLSKHIKSGIGIKIKLANFKTVSGIYKSSEEDGKLQLEHTDGTVFFVLEKDVLEVEYDSSLNRFLSPNNFFVGLIPGLPQYLQGKTYKGGILMGSSFLLGAGAIMEYNNTVKSSQNAEVYIPIGNQLIVTDSIGSNSNFQRHKSNFQILTLGFAALYLYHFFDTYYLNQPTPNLSNNILEPNGNTRELFSFPEKSGPYSFWSPSNIQYLEFHFKF